MAWYAMGWVGIGPLKCIYTFIDCLKSTLICFNRKKYENKRYKE